MSTIFAPSQFPLSGNVVSLGDPLSSGLSGGADVTTYTELSSAAGVLTSSGTHPKYNASCSYTGALPSFDFANSGALIGALSGFGANPCTIMLFFANFGVVGGLSYSGVFSMYGSGTDDYNDPNGIAISQKAFTTATLTSTQNNQSSSDLDVSAGGQFPSVLIDTINGQTSTQIVTVGDMSTGTTPGTRSTTVTPLHYGFGQRYSASGWTTNDGADFSLCLWVIWNTILTAPQELTAQQVGRNQLFVRMGMPPIVSGGGGHILGGGF